MLQAKNVSIKYNNANGAWHVRYQGPSEVYQAREWGIGPTGQTIYDVYQTAGQAVLAASNLVLPPIDGVEIIIVDEIE